MQCVSWEASSRSASQAIPLILWKPKFHGHIHKRAPLVIILSQMNPVHIVHIFL
jgi:hypothetical protein